MGDAEGPGHKESEVQKLLHFPKKWEERPEAWERMTGKRVLFALLSKEVAVVRDVTFWKQARQLLATWKADFVDPPASCDIEQSVRTARKEAYDTAERLLTCAQEAARIAGSDGGHLPSFDGWEAPGRSTGAGLNHATHGRPWAWVCLRALLHRPLRSLDVPVALVDMAGPSGSIAALRLQLFSDGSGQAAHHAEDAFSTRFGDSHFPGSMADAWKVVRSAGEGAFPYDSAWRLLEGSDPVSLARGRSASGAAAWGWWFLLNDKIPDAQIIVVAQVTPEGRFGEVERHGIECKARAIAKSGRFDRVLVVGEENRSEFLKVFKKIGGRVPSIDVVNLDGSDSCVPDPE